MPFSIYETSECWTSEELKKLSFRFKKKCLQILGFLIYPHSILFESDQISYAIIAATFEVWTLLNYYGKRHLFRVLTSYMRYCDDMKRFMKLHKIESLQFHVIAWRKQRKRNILYFIHKCDIVSNYTCTTLYNVNLVLVHAINFLKTCTRPKWLLVWNKVRSSNDGKISFYKFSIQRLKVLGETCSKNEGDIIYHFP